MGAKTVARVISQTNHVTGVHLLAFPDGRLLQVSVNGLPVVNVIDAHMDAIVVPFGVSTDAADGSWGYRKYLTAAGGHDVNTFMPGQTKLGIVLGVGSEVLGDGAVVSGPNLEFETAHKPMGRGQQVLPFLSLVVILQQKLAEFSSNRRMGQVKNGRFHCSILTL